MICSKCGNTIPDGSVFCMVCGERVSEESFNELNNTISDEQEICESNKTSDNTQQIIPDESPESDVSKSKRSKKKIIILAVVAALVTIGIVIGIIIIATGQAKAAGMEKLHTNIQGEWYRTDDDTGDITYILELEIDKYDIEYTFVSPLIVETIANYDYTIISPNQFYVDSFTSSPHTVSFSDNNTTMKITPALTSTEPYEIWFKLD